MNKIQIKSSLPVLYIALTGLLIHASGCQLSRGISNTKERISDTKLISKMSGKTKKDDIVLKKYQELLGQEEKKNDQSSKKEVVKTIPLSSDRSNTAPDDKKIQQASFEAPVNENNMAAAHNALIQKNYPVAAKLYKKILMKDPSNPMINHRLAIINDELKNYSTAELHYMTAMITKPNDPNLLSDLGYSYLLQGKYNKSEEFLKRAIMQSPNHVRAIDNLGYLYGKQAQFDLALQYFRNTGTEIEAQRKLQQVKIEVASQYPQQQPQMANHQLNNANYNQNGLTEIPPAPIHYQQPVQQITGSTLQAPNPLTTLMQPSQTASNLNQPQRGFHQNQQALSPQQNQIANPNQLLQPRENTYPLPQKQAIQNYQGGKLSQFGQKKSVEPVTTPATNSGKPDNALSPEGTWPPADLKNQENKTPQGAPVQPTTFLQQNQSNQMNQANFSYPQGQRPNQVSNIPTHYQGQTKKPIQRTAAVMGMNAGPGGMFPVMNQSGLNQASMNQQNHGSQQSIQTFKPQQRMNGQQLTNPNQINQNPAWPQNNSQQMQQNGYLQNQQMQPNGTIQNSQFNSNGSNPQTGIPEHIQDRNGFSHGGLEVSTGHHLMHQSPVQIFEQKYFEDMEKARTSQKQEHTQPGTATWVQQ